MTAYISEMLSYPFMSRAFITGLFISAAASCIGVNLVLRHFSMIGDGLSHSGFGALAVAVALHQSPLLISLPAVLLCATLILSFSQKIRLPSDASIAMLSSVSLSVGVMVLSVTTGMNTDVCNYLFGSILGMKVNDMYITMALCSAVILIYILMYNNFFAVTFDSEFARAAGVKVGRCNFILAMMCAVIIAVGMKMMGALLISNLIVMPALTAMRICRRYMITVIYSIMISIFCFISGLTISYSFSTPTGASIVLVNLALFLLHCLLASLKRRCI